MWILMGLAALLLGICTYSDLKNREIDVSLLILFALLSVAYRGAYGLWWQGFFELFLRLVPGALLLIIHMIKRSWLGPGDVFLVAVCGYMLGAETIFRTVLLAFVFSGVCGLLLLLTRKMRGKDTIPFIPFLLAGFLGAAFIQCIIVQKNGGL